MQSIKGNPLHTKEERRNVHMDLQRYDVIKAKIKYQGEGSVQIKERPYVIISNPIGTKHASIITVMPLTTKLKKLNMPVHSCINADDDNGLTEYSMVLGEQIITISKDEVIERLGNIADAYERKLIDKACFNGLFFGTEYRLEEARV